LGKIISHKSGTLVYTAPFGARFRVNRYLFSGFEDWALRNTPFNNPVIFSRRELLCSGPLFFGKERFMFSFLQKKNFFKKAGFVAFVFLAVMLAGCSNGTTDESDNILVVPEKLKGAWLSIWDEEFTITDTTFTSGYGGAVTYEGTIVNVRSLNGGNDSGYITIKYTIIGEYSTGIVDNFYVIHWKNLTDGSIDIAGAKKGEGKANQTEAEEFYIVENGEFTGFSSITREGAGPEIPVPQNLKNTWNGSDGFSDHTFKITENTLNYSMDSYPVFLANIVKVNKKDDNTGYLVFQYTLFSSPLKEELINKYCALYYETSSDGAKLAIFNDGADGTFGDAGEDTLEGAEELFVITNSDYHDPEWDLISCTN
jgi:hypothetical protein